MDNRNIRKRRDVTKETLESNQGGSAFSDNTRTIRPSHENENYQNNGKEKYKNSGININENFNKYMNSFSTSFNPSTKNKKENGIDTWRNHDKKKGGNIFNSSNISTISSTCKKSFSDMINTINNNMKSFSENMPNNNNAATANWGESVNRMGNVDSSKNNFRTPNPNTHVGIMFQGTSATNLNSDFRLGNINGREMQRDYLGTVANSTNNFATSGSISERDRRVGITGFGIDVGSETKSGNRNISRNWNGERDDGDKDRNRGGYNDFYNMERNAGPIKQLHINTKESQINSANLEDFVNTNVRSRSTGDAVNTVRHNYAYNMSREMESMRIINNDETYFTCLDNLLRNHGNIDSEEMLKYNDKNINFLNDIIFLDVYRAYNVMTYMQNKINLIILTIKFIGKKLKRKHVPEEIVISLEFLSFCIKNIGLFFIRHIDESFMKKLSKLLRSTTLKKSITKNVKSKLSKFLIVPVIHPGVATDPRLHFIKRKILFLLQLWHDAFITHKVLLSPVYDEYRSLKERGITFPIISNSEKFFVKDSESSLGMKNVFVHLPLNPCQIENILNSVKEISNMKPSEEKTKCVFIISKYKNQIVECINTLSEYKGSVNIEPTLKSLLYINDEMEHLNRLEKEKDSQNDSQKEQSEEKENDDELASAVKREETNKTKKKKKKREKEKEKRDKQNFSEIIFSNFDPWNTPPNTQTKETKETKPTEDLFFDNAPEDLFGPQVALPVSENNRISEVTKTIQVPANADVDKYSVFNEIQMSDAYGNGNEKSNRIVSAGNIKGRSDGETSLSSPANEYDPPIDIATLDVTIESNRMTDVSAQQLTNSPDMNCTEKQEEIKFYSLQEIDVSYEEMLPEKKQIGDENIMGKSNDISMFDNLEFVSADEINKKKTSLNNIDAYSTNQITKELFVKNFPDNESRNKEVYKTHSSETEKEEKEDTLEEVIDGTINDALKHCSNNSSDNIVEEFGFNNNGYKNSLYNNDKEKGRVIFENEKRQDEDSFVERGYNELNTFNLEEYNNDTYPPVFSTLENHVLVDEIQKTNEPHLSVYTNNDVVKNNLQSLVNEGKTSSNDKVNISEVSETDKINTENMKSMKNISQMKTKEDQLENHIREKDQMQEQRQELKQEQRQELKQEQNQKYAQEILETENEYNNRDTINELSIENSVISGDILTNERSPFSQSFQSNVFDDSVLKKNQSNKSNESEKRKMLEKKSDATNSSDVNDVNIDEFDEINKALDDLNSNFENLDGYKYD